MERAGRYAHKFGRNKNNRIKPPGGKRIYPRKALPENKKQRMRLSWTMAALWERISWNHGTGGAFMGAHSPRSKKDGHFGSEGSSEKAGSGQWIIPWNSRIP